MHTTSMFKQYKWMNDIHVYFIWTYEKKFSHDYYCQIVTHEVCDDETNNNNVNARSNNQKQKTTIKDKK